MGFSQLYYLCNNFLYASNGTLCFLRGFPRNMRDHTCLIYPSLFLFDYNHTQLHYTWKINSVSGTVRRGSLVIVFRFVFGRAVIIRIVAVGILGRFVGYIRSVAVLIGFVRHDLFATVRQVNSVLTASQFILVRLTSGLFVTVIIINVELECVIVPSLKKIKFI